MRTRMTLILFLFFANCDSSVTPSQLDRMSVRQPTALEKRLGEESGSFGLKLFRQISSTETGTNQFISPVSIGVALGMSLNGASGSTYDSMKATLGLNGLSEDEINQSYMSLTELLLSTDPTVTMDIANSVWYRNTFSVEASFFDAVTRWHTARVEGLDFSSPTAPVTINAWVSEATHGRIAGIVPDQIPAETVMYLINTIYFKGTWSTRFDPSRTHDQMFTLENGSRRQVPFMHRSDTVLAGNVDGTQILELTYGEGRSYRMTFLLPSEGISVGAFVAQLTQDRWRSYLAALEEASVDIYVPKFRMEYERSLKDDLGAMGMGIAFTEWADFSRINPNAPLAISDVRHKSFVQVDEEGTEAAAATSVEIGLTSVPLSVSLNRPFVFAVRDVNSGAIIFIGKIADPVW